MKRVIISVAKIALYATITGVSMAYFFNMVAESLDNQRANDKVQLRLYEQYYQDTEDLLDQIDQDLNWSDAIDSYHYYESKKELNKVRR